MDGRTVLKLTLKTLERQGFMWHRAESCEGHLATPSIYIKFGEILY
jgi:hypothetical protein